MLHDVTACMSVEASRQFPCARPFDQICAGTRSIVLGKAPNIDRHYKSIVKYYRARKVKTWDTEPSSTLDHSLAITGTAACKMAEASCKATIPGP